jgi:hypothetical protein
MTDLSRTPEEEILEIELQLEKLNEILLGQIEPTLTLPESDGPLPDNLVAEMTGNYEESHRIWTEQQTTLNQKIQERQERLAELQE